MGKSVKDKTVEGQEKKKKSPKKKKNKKKVSNSSNESKKNPKDPKKEYKVPSRVQKHMRELTIDNGHISLVRDRKYAMAFAQSAPGEEAKTWRFAKVSTPKESVHRKEYYVFNPKLFKVYMHKVASTWFLYKLYFRCDKLTIVDAYEEKVHYLQSWQDDRLKQSVDAIYDYMSITPVLVSEHHNRRVYRHPKFTSTARCDLLAYPRKAFAREWKLGITIWPCILALNSHIIRKSMEQRLLTIQYKSLSELDRTKKDIDTFRKTNPGWWNARQMLLNNNMAMSMSDDEAKRMLRDRNHPYNQMSAHAAICELHQIPPAVGYLYYICRTLKPITITISPQDVCYKIENGNKRPIKVRTSTYQYRPNAVSIFKEERGDDLSLAMCLPGRHAPSLESMSGFSTNSRASTATISPGDWLVQWKSQPRHKELEHRMSNYGYPNPVEIRRIGEMELCQRLSDEVEYRLKNVGTNMTTFTYSRFPGFFDVQYGTMPPIRRKKSVIKNVSLEMEKRRESMTNTAITPMALQLLDYSYQQLSHTFPLSPNDPYLGLDISPGWRSLIDNKLANSDTFSNLTRIINSHHSWIRESPFSLSSRVPRADKQTVQAGVLQIPFRNSLVRSLLVILIVIIALMLSKIVAAYY